MKTKSYTLFTASEYRIGIDLGGTKIEGVLLDGDGRCVAKKRRRTPKNYPDTVAALTAMVETFDRLAAPTQPPPVGVGTPGAWVAATGAMKNCNSTWLNGKPLLDDLNVNLHGRVRIANDANCFALSEALAGAGSGASVVFGVILGTGVGGGIVVNGRLLTGANAVAGEWGHTPLPYFRTDPSTTAVEEALPDRPCYCGRVNCVETFLSGPGLAKTHEAIAGERLAVEAIPETAASVDLYITMLARSLAQLVNVLDPDVVVLGGGVSNIARLTENMPHHLSRYGFTLEGRTKVTRALHGDASGVLGAARLWP